MRINRPGFTLIEAISVIAIIGILATLGITYGLGVQKSARDATRKNDLYAISQGLAARFTDRTCSDQSVVGRYPNPSSAVSNDNALAHWVDASKLNNDSSCAPFSTYLSHVPAEPLNKNPYMYNLANGPQLPAVHYRLATLLERPSDNDLSTCSTESNRWSDTTNTGYGGQPYNCPGAANQEIAGYNYYLGQ